MSVLYSQVVINNYTPTFGLATISTINTGTINVSTVNSLNINNSNLVTTKEIQAVGGSISTLSSSQIYALNILTSNISANTLVLGANTLNTSNTSSVYLNGVPLATTDNLSSSLSNWSLDPAVSDVDMANHNLSNALGVYTANLFVTATGSIKIVNSSNITASNDIMTNTLEATGLITGSGGMSTIFSKANSITASTIFTRAITASTVTFSTLIGPIVLPSTLSGSNLALSNLSVSTSTTLGGTTSIDALTVNNSSVFYGTRPNFTTGINTNGANNFNFTNLDNTSNINGNVINLSPQNNLNINTSNAMTVNVNRGADIGGSAVVNLTAVDGAGSLISLNANSAHPTALTPTSAVNINAQGNVGSVTDAPFGGAVNITAEAGLAGIGASVAGGGGINLTAYSYGAVAAGTIKLSGGSIIAYSGLTTPRFGIIGNSYYSALNCLSLTAGASPATTSYPGVVYLRGDSGTKVVNGFYTDSISATGNSVLPTINTYSITAPSGSNIALFAIGNSINMVTNTISLYAVSNVIFTTPSITASGSMDIASLTSISSINGSVYPAPSGAGVWASTATTDLNMNNHSINNISNLSFRGGGFIKDYTPSIHLFDFDGNNCDQTRILNGSANIVLLPGSGGQTYFGGADYYFQGNVHLMGHSLDMGNGDITNVKNIYMSNTTIYNAGELYNNNTDLLLSGLGRNIILQTFSGGAIFLSGTVTTSNNVFMNGGFLQMNCNAIRICSDQYHALAFGNSGTYNVGVNGPFLVGYNSGALGTSGTSFNNKSLEWSYTDVYVYKRLDMCNNNIINTGTITSSNVYAGAAVIGTSPFGSRYAYFANNTFSTVAASYALIQSDSGETFLNCSSNNVIRFRNGDNEVMILTSSNLNMCNHSITGLSNLYSAGDFNIFAPTGLGIGLNNNTYFNNFALGDVGRINMTSGAGINVNGGYLSNVQQITFLGGNITTGSNYLDINGNGPGNYTSLKSGGSYYTIDTAGNNVMYSSNVAGVRANNNVYIQSDTSYVELIANGGTGTIYHTAGFTEFRGNAGFTQSNSYITGLGHIYGNTSSSLGGLAIDYMYGMFFNSAGNNANLYASIGNLIMRNYNGGIYIENYNAPGTGNLALYSASNDVILGTGAGHNIAINSGSNIYMNAAGSDGLIALYASTINTQTLQDTNIGANRYIQLSASQPGGAIGLYTSTINATTLLDTNFTANRAVTIAAGTGDINLRTSSGNFNASGAGTGHYASFNNGSSYLQFDNNLNITLNSSSNITITNGGSGNSTNFTGGDVYFSGGTVRIPGSSTQIDMWNNCSINQNSGDMSLNTQGYISLNATTSGKAITLNTSTITLNAPASINLNGPISANSNLNMNYHDITNLSYVSGSNIVIQDLGGNLDLLSYRVALPSGFLDLPATNSKIDFNNYCYISRDYGTSNFNIKASRNLSILASTVTRNLGATEVIQPIIQYGTATATGVSGNVLVTLSTPYTSATSYIATASMMDTTECKISVNRNSSSNITIYWSQAGSGTQTLGWNTMGQ
jgi:hypothetical protein